MSLNENRLREILNQIDMNRNLKNQYHSKWLSIVNFLYNNTGLSIAQAAMGGSMAKRTFSTRSDMDVIFCLSYEQSRDEVYPPLITKINANFGQIAHTYWGDRAIHINFESLMFDLVLLSQREFTEEYSGIKDIRQLNQTKTDAIKLIKYAVDKAGYSYACPGYVIENCILKSREKTLISLITGCNHLIGIPITTIISTLQ